MTLHVGQNGNEHIISEHIHVAYYKYEFCRTLPIPHLMQNKYVSWYRYLDIAKLSSGYQQTVLTLNVDPSENNMPQHGFLVHIKSVNVPLPIVTFYFEGHDTYILRMHPFIKIKLRIFDISCENELNEWI